MTHQMFCVHTMPAILNSCPNLARIYVCGKLGQRNHNIIVTSPFSNCFVFKMLSVRTKTQSRSYQIPTVGGACFRNGLVWTVGLTIEIKLGFQTSPAWCGRDLSVLVPMHLWSAAKTSWQPPLSNNNSSPFFWTSCNRAGEMPSKSSFRLCSESFLLQKWKQKNSEIRT